MANLLVLSKELQLIAETELNEASERIQTDIEHIRMWLFQQRDIKARTDDNTLISFLRNCKYSLEKTKRKMEQFYMSRTAFPKIFRNRSIFDPKFQFVFKENIVSILPALPNGPVYVLIRCSKNADPNFFSTIDTIKVATMVFDVAIREYVNCSVVGQVLLIDFKHLPYQYFPQITPTFVKTLTFILQKAYPSRFRGVHFLNVPSMLVAMYQLFVSLLPKKIKDKTFCHASDENESIQKHIPLSILPTEYGGDAGPNAVLCEQLRMKIEKYENFFVEDDVYGCHEETKLSLADLNSDLFSAEGSFRKLEID